MANLPPSGFEDADALAHMELDLIEEERRRRRRAAEQAQEDRELADLMRIEAERERRIAVEAARAGFEAQPPQNAAADLERQLKEYNARQAMERDRQKVVRISALKHEKARQVGRMIASARQRHEQQAARTSALTKLRERTAARVIQRAVRRKQKSQAERVRRDFVAYERTKWQHNAERLLFLAHLEASKKRAWNDALGDKTDDVDTEGRPRGWVPSTFNRRYPFIVEDLKRAGITETVVHAHTGKTLKQWVMDSMHRLGPNQRDQAAVRRAISTSDSALHVNSSLRMRRGAAAKDLARRQAAGDDSLI